MLGDSPSPREIGKPEIVEQLRRLGVRRAGVLLVHASFRAARPVEGGPDGLIAAVREALGPQGTLVMPSWSDDDSVPFDPRRSSVAADLGILAETLRTMPGVWRSDHAFAFAAIGPRAAEIVADPLPIPPHRPESPAGRVHELDGQVLLLGVGHDADTTLHLAEVLAGVPYGVTKHITVVRDGRPERLDYVETDHCCERFSLADGWLRANGLQSDGPVGHAHARLFRARDVVAAALDVLRREPLVFLHAPEAGCAECDSARESVPEG